MSERNDAIARKNKADWNAYSAKYMAYNLTEERLAPVFRDPSSAFDPAVWALLRRYMPEMGGKQICVPSSGDHHAVFAFALLGAQVTSCDIAENQLAAAQRAAQAHGVAERIRFVCSDTMRLDEIEADAYDMVYTSNGVHVWISDLNAMYRSIARVLKPGGLSVLYELHPFQRPFGPGLKVVRTYAQTGPFEDAETVTFHWRMQDILNAVMDAGIRPMHLEEIMPKKDYDHPFFVKNSDVVNGNAPSREEIDRMYTLENNPGMALPEMFCMVGQKA